MSESAPVFVNLCTDKAVHVSPAKGDIEKKLRYMGFKNRPDGAEGYSYESDFSRPESYGQIFTELADLKIFFSAGHDWSPSDIVSHLLEKKVLKADKEFYEIFWTGSGAWNVRLITA